MKIDPAIRASLLVFSGVAGIASPSPAQSPYDFGNPTAEEQAYIEMINRARANPPAEGARLAATTDPDVVFAYSYFSVNLGMMQSEFNAIAAQPPLAPNSKLATAARSHSAWMLANDTQSHNQTSPNNTPFDRIQNAGYSYSTAGENIFAYAESAWHGHAGFEVDWGGGTGGMQNPRGHRNSIHSGNFREIGVGVLLGSNTNTGPQVVTQDFGTQHSSPSFGTGVAYYDLNGNDFYDVGEGISGLTVNVSGTSNHCLTAIGGGWVVPIPDSAATRTVSFSGLNINQNVPLNVPASANAKADLKLTYSPPTITSTDTAPAGTPHTVEFGAVGGASAYQWKRWNLADTADENAETIDGITSSTTGTYSVLNTSVKQEGSASFHLENSTGNTQWIELKPLYFGQDIPSISFQSRVRYSTSDEYFKVQIKEEGSALWQDVYNQTGSNSPGEGSFSLRSGTLTGVTGKAFRVRFMLEHTGSFYSGYSGDQFGWFIDAISFSGVSSLENPASQSLAGTSGSFTPTVGSYLMAVAPVISNHEFPASYQTLAVSSPPATPTYAGWATDEEAENELAADTLSDPNADFDHDGRCNLMEYAFGTSPVIANDPAPRMPTMQASATHFIIQYQRDTDLGDITLTAQTSSDMQNWNAPGDASAPAGFVDELISTAGNIETHEARVPLKLRG